MTLRFPVLYTFHLKPIVCLYNFFLCNVSYKRCKTGILDISLLFSAILPGEQGIDVFQREAGKRNICIAISEKVPSDASDAKFMEVVTNLMKKPNARAVVLFTRMEDAR